MTSYVARAARVRLTVSAVALLVWVDIALRTRGFRAVRRLLARRPAVIAGRTIGVDEVCEAVNFACGLSLAPPLCLRRSILTALMLRRKGVPASLVLGITPLGGRGHAWVEVDGRIVNDRFFTASDYFVIDRI